MRKFLSTDSKEASSITAYQKYKKSNQFKFKINSIAFAALLSCIELSSAIAAPVYFSHTGFVTPIDYLNDGTPWQVTRPPLAFDSNNDPYFSNLFEIGTGGAGTFTMNQAAAQSSYIRMGMDASATMTMNDGSSWNIIRDNTIFDSGWLDIGQNSKSNFNLLSGSTINSYRFDLGYLSNGDGTMIVDGLGTKLTNSNQAYVGTGGKGDLTVTNSGVFESNTLYIGQSNQSSGNVLVENNGYLQGIIITLAERTGSAGTLTINGDATTRGVVGAMYLQKGAGTANLIINGGKVKALQSNQSSFFKDFDNLEIGENGIYFDTGIYNNINILTNFSSKIGQTKGLIKQGSGSLTINADSIFYGNSSVESGTLTVEKGKKFQTPTMTITGKLSLSGDATSRATLLTSQVIKNSSGTLDLNGGSLKSLSNQSDFLSGFSNITLGNLGVVFDTNGYNIGVSSIFSSTGPQTNGLEKQGLGILLLNESSTYQGNTMVSAGTLQTGKLNALSSSSTHTISTGATLNLNGYNQTIKSLSNSGTVKISESTSGAPATTLKVTGAYVGNNGILGISTVLDTDGSASDKLLLSGASAIASGTTTIQITNAGGLGALTTSAGIPVIVTELGASLDANSFSLAGEHVDAGAYQYRLYQTSNGAVLRSSATPSTLNNEPAYRSEVPLIGALAAQLRQADFSMLGNLTNRIGDNNLLLDTNDETSHNRRSWGRFIYIDPKISQQSVVTPQSKGHLKGFQAGTDLYANKNFNTGFYVGQLSGKMHSNGYSAGIENKYVGSNDLQNRYLGIYGTWRDASGWYADAVIQGVHYKNTLKGEGSSSQSKLDGKGWLTSLEVGFPIAISNNWKIEPQVQIIYQKMNIKDISVAQTTIKTKADDSLIARIGSRVKGKFDTSIGQFQPYGRFNIYKASRTNDINNFITNVENTTINTAGGYTSIETALGGTWSLNKQTSLYGEFGKVFSTGSERKFKTGLQLSIGAKFIW